MAIKKVMPKVNQQVLSELRGTQFQPQAPVYVMEDNLVTIPSDLYSVETKDIPARGTREAFTLHISKFEINGEQFEIAYRSGVVPDSDDDLVISRYKAERDFETSSGKLIKKGTVKIFAANAA